MKTLEDLTTTAQPTTKLHCEVCKKPLLDTPDNSHMVEIKRGYFQDNDDDEPIECVKEKAVFFICVDCYLTDPDLCSFFNKIGWRIR